MSFTNVGILTDIGLDNYALNGLSLLSIPINRESIMKFGPLCPFCPITRLGPTAFKYIQLTFKYIQIPLNFIQITFIFHWNSFKIHSQNIQIKFKLLQIINFQVQYMMVQEQQPNSPKIQTQFHKKYLQSHYHPTTNPTTWQLTKQLTQTTLSQPIWA